MFLVLVAIFTPFLGIALSIVYRSMGHQRMARRLLQISVVVLLLQFIFVVVVWSHILPLFTNFLPNL